MRHDSRTSCLILGYYERGNIGDDAMKAALERALDSVGSLMVSCRRLPPMSFRHWREAVALAKTMREADVVILGGGTHFDDTKGLRSLRLLLGYVAVFAFVRAAGRRVAYAGIGVGPLTSSLGRRLTGLLLRFAEVILVRDQASANEVHKLGGDSVVCGFDIVAAVDAPTRPEPTQTRYSIAISLVPHFHLADGRPDRDLVLVDGLVRALARARPQLRAILSVPFFVGRLPNDVAVSARMCEGLNDRAVPCVLSGERDWTRVLAEICAAQALIAMRYHAILFGFLVGIPMVVVPYHRKCRDLALEIGMPREAVREPSELLTAGAWEGVLDKLLAKPGFFLPSVSVAEGRRRAMLGLKPLIRCLTRHDGRSER